MVSNGTLLCRQLKWLSGLMVALSALAFAIPVVRMSWPALGGLSAYDAAHFIADFAFWIAALFALGTGALFFRRPEDFIKIRGKVEWGNAHRKSSNIFLFSMVLVIVSIYFRFARPPWIPVAEEMYAIIASGLVTFSLLTLDISFISLSRSRKLKREWLGFATEACKLDLAVFVSFVVAAGFVACAAGYVGEGHPHELKLVVCGLEAALLTVSTVAFSLDSGGLFKPRKYAVPVTAHAGASLEGVAQPPAGEVTE